VNFTSGHPTVWARLTTAVAAQKCSIAAEVADALDVECLGEQVSLAAGVLARSPFRGVVGVAASGRIPSGDAAQRGLRPR